MCHLHPCVVTLPWPQCVVLSCHDILLLFTPNAKSQWKHPVNQCQRVGRGNAQPPLLLIEESQAQHPTEDCTQDIPSNYQGIQVVSRINANVKYYDIQSTWLSFFILVLYAYIWGFLVAQMVKNLPAMLEAQVQSPGQKDPLEKGMVTHSMPHTLTGCFKYVFKISRSPRSI